MSDEMFWLLIPNGFNTQDMSSISIINNKTLFRKRVRRNELPYQSLLKLSGKQFCNKYSSTLIKAHGLVVFVISILSQQDNNSTICLEHDKILIDPLLFYKYNIKYKKVTQNPHEILILSLGILSQSFTQDEIICESIDFALPSWFYNEFPKNSSLCYCKLSSSSNKHESIDLNLYKDETIQGYIQKYLQLNTHQNLSFLDNINEEDFLMNICDESMKFSQFYNDTYFNELFSSEDFFNDIFMNSNQCESSNNAEILNITDIPPPSNDQLSKILYLSNLNKKIRKNDLKNYFIGSPKIILEQRQVPPYLNYAFIFHRTNLQVEYNQKRANSSSRFGSNCQIEFVKNLSDLSNKKWNIVIKQISENDLKKLFLNYDKIKCIPARIVQKSRVSFISVTHGAMDVNALARCIMSEASTGNRNEQIAIGFACQRNRNHASNQPPTYNVTKLAQDILAGKINDITNGANHWYSPRSMPSEAEKPRCKKPFGAGRMDCNGGLEKSCGKSRNYKPGWAKNRNPVYIPNVRDCYFKFFLL
ncbi:unnamed protein product [Adineta steineri]|uniref:Uncharacterized protein n=1 Tax=Adineta steineri TaxID=433720 RepID=A0A818S6P4_9BILA|nr:unnamed protein product [Adineta steineri]CAF3664404.1 unnamed protein product [Adineta steineri]